MKKSRMLTFILILSLLLIAAITLIYHFAGGKKEMKETFINPIRSAPSADPWVIQKDGYYYYCYSNGNNKIFITKTKRLQDIDVDIPVNVWTSPLGKDYSKGTWAPELHFIDNKWYIYFAADDGKNETHRMYVLECKTEDPQGEYTFKGKVSDDTNKWAIDGTVLENKGKLYFIWSGWDSDTNVSQNLYIAEMSNPYTISGKRILISKPEKTWETIGQPYVNEGPEILRKGNNIHIVYSASGSWTEDYCLGLLTNTDGDLLNPSSWKKSGPVFSKAETAYGPGHASFVKSTDGNEDWIVYHACEAANGGWDGRSIRAQKFTWENDYPKFGEPINLQKTIEVPSGTPKQD
ncbi:glycosyl hydrolase family 43 [Clostridium zeae]|uniref:Glycosyl hydrolase family 43 n=1 Tax=Clostridium zeae TaxID=2759022 RepID=A0ABQ1E7N7_9CLOT|nr:glycoside hydrolase family 43 protein [Clostridium zeae]GFZ30797.1 glycosyl hydrolase family 43 [Clostridium zeae]